MTKASIINCDDSANFMSLHMSFYDSSYCIHPAQLQLPCNAMSFTPGKQYYYGKFHIFKTKSGAQDAHEAIRPTHVELDPERIQGSLTREQYRLYKLIWSRFLASQMANAVYDTVSIDTACAGHIFRSSHQSIKFSGFIAVYEEGKDEETVMDAARKVHAAGGTVIHAKGTGSSCIGQDAILDLLVLQLFADDLRELTLRRKMPF